MLAMIVKLTVLLLAWMVMALTCCRPKLVVMVAAISSATRRPTLRKANILLLIRIRALPPDPPAGSVVGTQLNMAMFTEMIEALKR
jgi:hypothetical protein